MDNLESVIGHMLETNDHVKLNVDNIAIEARTAHVNTFIGLTCWLLFIGKTKETYCEQTALSPEASIKLQKVRSTVALSVTACLSVRLFVRPSDDITTLVGTLLLPQICRDRLMAD